jgi:tRNA(adenine34) deaminase
MNAIWPEQDVTFMRAAVEAANAAAASGEVPVGAAVVIDGAIVGTGHNQSVACHDPSGHAEIVALRAACGARENYRLPGATLYVTLEPCAMCVGAIVQARISRLVFGAYDPKAGAVGSVVDMTDSPAWNHRFEVNGGIMADECGVLLRDFFRARR